MAAAFAALASLHNNLHLIQNHPRHYFTFENEQIESLGGSVNFLMNFMKTVSNAHWSRKEAAEALEMRIARAVQAAEDVIESHVVDQILSGKTRAPSKTKSCRFLLDLQKVIHDMDYMRRKAINIQTQIVAEARQQPAYSYSTAAAPTPTLKQKNSISMVGFDDVLLQLLDKLTGAPSSRQVIPIVGMGGIGKTTLATNAFQHPSTKQHFDLHLWATISQQYNVHKILKQLLSVDKSTSETVDELGLRLHKNLYGRRYLVVLDDMWSLQAWDEIKFFFPDFNHGSRIVVTTRHWDVANHLGFSSLEINFLDEEYSWDLFCQKAFAAEQGCPPELKGIGMEIVEKCKGLPLAIAVVAGHLRNTMTLQYWENVANRLNSAVLNSTENEEGCLDVLLLSYSYLPPHLKPCFLLLGVFPEDEVISWGEVGKLWIAEGLIEPAENTLLEKVAEDYLWDLYERNLILLVDGMDFDGNIVDFKLHDLLREMCIKIGEEEEFLVVVDSPGAIGRKRRVVITGEEVAEANCEIKTLDALTRCLIYEGDWPPCNLKLLRTLDMVVSETTSVSMFQQVNLRLLHVNLENTQLSTLYLPSSISLLWNLQMLSIDVPDESTVIAPYEVWEMLQLRHLEIDLICLVDPLPVERLDERSDMVMKSLHTLLEVENFRLSEEVCRRIPNIRELHLLYCDEASSYHCPQNLCYLDKLEYFSCEIDLNSNRECRDFGLSLTFPTSLKWLFLCGCRVDWEEMTAMVGSLPHLISLQLLQDAVIGSVWTSAEDKFRSLKNLEIWECDELVELNVESSHFPVLERLHLRNLSKLEKLCSDIGEIPTLETIVAEFCSITSSTSAIRTLKEQQELGNEELSLCVSVEGDEETVGSFVNQLREEGLIPTKNLSMNLNFDYPYLEFDSVVMHDLFSTLCPGFVLTIN